MIEGEKSAVVDFFDEFSDYQIYYHGPWKFYRQRCLDLLKKSLRSKKRLFILDLGCGRLCSFPSLLDDLDVQEYHCVDFSLESIHALRQNIGSHPNVRIFYQDVVEFVQNSSLKYDVVILFGLVMYLSKEQACKLFTGINQILSAQGSILIHEPNERAKMQLDPFSHGLDSVFLRRLLSELKNGYGCRIRCYNIAFLRKPLFVLFYYLKKFIQGPSEQRNCRTLFIQKIEDNFWFFESFLENFLSSLRLGCDLLILVQKKGSL